MIVELAEKFANQERYKNGRVLLSLSKSRKYQYLNSSLKQFTKSKDHQDFSKYRFRDLTEKFLQDFVVWVQIEAAKNGNTGDVSGKLRKLKAVCLYAKEQGVYNVNFNAFGSFKEKLKHRITTPKGVSPEVMQQIESFERMLLTKKEQLYIELFLFSYYTGGMSAIDVCLLTRNQIKDDLIISYQVRQAGKSHYYRQIGGYYRTLQKRGIYELRLPDHQAMQSNPIQTLRTSEANK